MRIWASDTIEMDGSLKSQNRLDGTYQGYVIVSLVESHWLQWVPLDLHHYSCGQSLSSSPCSPPSTNEAKHDHSLLCSPRGSSCLVKGEVSGSTRELICQVMGSRNAMTFIKWTHLFSTGIHYPTTRTCHLQPETVTITSSQVTVPKSLKESGGTIIAKMPTWMGCTGWEPTAAKQMGWTGRPTKGSTIPTEYQKWNLGLLSPALSQQQQTAREVSLGELVSF